MSKSNQTSISTYHEYINEAIYSLRHGLSLEKQAKLIYPDIGSDHSIMTSEIICRYSFLMVANSLEAAANALLLSFIIDNEYYNELERTGTLVKFKLFCNFSGKRLDQGNVKYSSVKDIIICRNEFVHPKPRIINYEIDGDGTSINYVNSKAKVRKYPTYFSEIKPFHVLDSLKDTLIFLSWVCFDVCKLEIQDGALRLGLGSYGSTADIDIIENENNIIFDKRTFGMI